MSVDEAVAVTAAPSGRTGTPLSVLVVGTSLHGGGAEWVGTLWMRYLVERGHRVTAAVTSAKDTDAHRPDGVELVSLGGAGSHVGKIRALRDLLMRLRPDVALGMQNYPNLLLLAAARSLPSGARPKVVLSERNLLAYGLQGASAAHRVRHGIAKRTYRFADHVIPLSHPVSAELAGGFGIPAARSTVVQNPAAEKVTAAAVRHPADPDVDVDVVIAHRLVEQKRPLLPIRVVAELRRRGVGARLTVFGVGPLLEQMRTLARELDVPLDHRGWAESWFDECSDRAVFLLASHREGFGNVLVQAAAAGVPSVALSGALGVADALVPGLTGELAIDDSPATIADAVRRAADLRIDRTVIGGWLDHFSLARSGAALESVLTRTAAA